MKRGIFSAMIILFLAMLACGSGTPAAIPTLQSSPYDLGRTVYGFFPSPPEASLQSILDTYEAIGQHADVVLLQQNIPWNDFAASAEADSKVITDIRNQYILAYQNGLEVIFVVDPLNGLNRTQFYNLPSGWQAGFDTPEVRTAFTNFTMRVVREFHPRYLGLASEINTYADAYPDDFQNYLSLYRAVYAMVKAESPATQVFVTFQWEDLNNLELLDDSSQTYHPKWELVEAFEPQLDVWAISSYPFVVFEHGADIPADYYTPLLTRTDKPLAVAEGGFTSADVGNFHGTLQDQVDYLNAIHTQIGNRLSFWIYLLLSDFNMDSYTQALQQQGHGGDAASLGLFSTVGLRSADGTPKPALDVWDSFRGGQ